MEKIINNPKYIEYLYNIHIQRYQNRLRKAQCGISGFRENELIELINIWNEVKYKNFIFKDLSKKAMVEVSDAVFDDKE